jgi:hypothetical protein
MPLRWYFEVGTEIAPSEFVAFTKSVLSANKGSPANPAAVAPTSGSRISVSGEQFVGADGITTTPQDFHYRDETLGSPCSMATAADGVTRCLPDGASVRWDFADDKCTISLAQVSRWDAPGIPSYALRNGHVFFIGAERTASQPVFWNASGECVPLWNDSYRYFAVGAEVPATDFVAFSRPDTKPSYRSGQKAR